MIALFPFDDFQAQRASPDIVSFTGLIETLRLPLLSQEPRLLPPHPCHPSKDCTPDSIQAYGHRGRNTHAAIRREDTNMQVLNTFPVNLDIDAAARVVLSIHYGSSKLP